MLYKIVIHMNVNICINTVLRLALCIHENSFGLNKKISPLILPFFVFRYILIVPLIYIFCGFRRHTSMRALMAQLASSGFGPSFKISHLKCMRSHEVPKAHSYSEYLGKHNTRSCLASAKLLLAFF